MSDLEHEVLKNYRPINKIPFLAKVIERIVAMQLKHHLAFNDLFTETQSPYRTIHSIETAMPCHDINFTLDNHNEVVLVLLDSSSGFETIGNGVLIKKFCTRVGLSGSALAWIDSYLN